MNDIKLVGTKAFEDFEKTIPIYKDLVSEKLGRNGDLPKIRLLGGVELVGIHYVPQDFRKCLNNHIPFISAGVLAKTLNVSQAYNYQTELVYGYNKRVYYDGYIRSYRMDVYCAKTIRLLFEELKIDEKYIRAIVAVATYNNKRYCRANRPTRILK